MAIVSSRAVTSAKDQVVSKLESKGFNITEFNRAFFDAVIEVLVPVIINEIVVNGVINTNVVVTTPSGPGTGTGVGTIS